MTTALISHPAFLNHLVPPGHAESPERLQAILEALKTPSFDALLRRQAPPATRAQLERVQTPCHVDHVLDNIPAEGFFSFDPDTPTSPGSGEAALRAAGGVVSAVDLIMAGEADNAFCASRPPGHHAEAERAMGFCLFNNVAIGALHARVAHGLKRVAVVDFDVHHGNGTQAVFWNDSNLFYGSTHQFPFYPGTGAAGETGHGNIVNVPLPAQAGSAAFRAAITDRVIPALRRFSPDFLLISAGFDAHRADPLGELMLDEEDFAWVTRALCEVAAMCCDGRLVSVLEGGYNVSALASSVVAHVAALMKGCVSGDRA
ncbi:MAG: histone deacetylase family protein [Alphaproteobacteria bacterium]|nr:MAG: histone deacetylase family protein [Alphaproteobacteria bacterium]